MATVWNMCMCISAVFQVLVVTHTKLVWNDVLRDNSFEQGYINCLNEPIVHLVTYVEVLYILIHYSHPPVVRMYRTILAHSQ